MSDTSTYRRQAGEEVIEIVCKARNEAYGDAEDNFQNIADLWNVIFAPKLCEELTPIDVARAMIQVKEARKIQDPEHEDSWLDTGGYTLCGLGITRARKARELAEAEIEEERVDRAKSDAAVDAFEALANPADVAAFEAYIKKTAKDVNPNIGLGDYDPFAVYQNRGDI